MNTGEFIRNRRIELGLTQSEVAQACGVTRSAVCKWQKGDIKNAKRQKIVQLAKVLRVDPMDITRVQIGQDVEDTQEQIDMTPKQRYLMRSYRVLNDHEKQVVQSMIDALIKGMSH